MTTREPGASEVLTQGLALSPRSTAARASRPAATMTWGFDVFVQLVMAAITTSPSRSWWWGAAAGSVAAVCGVRSRRHAERLLGRGQRHPVLRAGRAGQRGHHVAQVERDQLGVDRLGRRRVVPQALGLGVGLDQREVRLLAPGEAQVVERHLVDGEHGAGRPVLGAHVADGGPGLEGQRGHPRPEALDEGADHAVVAEQLGHGEHDVGRRDAGLGFARNAQPHHGGQQHGEGLAQHGRLRLDPAHAPAEHAEPVDHHGVRVGADQAVAVGPPVLGGEDEARQVLEVDLVADAHARRHGPEVAEGALGPAQQLVALQVALVLDRHVGVVGRGVARALDDDRVVDDQLDRHQRVDLGGVAAQVGQRVAHGGQVDHGRHAGEVLHQDALGGEGDLVRRVARALAVALGVAAPGRRGHDVVGRHVRPVLVAQQVLEQHLDGVGQAVDVVPLGQARRLDVEDLVGLVADHQVGAGAEGVGMRIRAHAPILPWPRGGCLTGSPGAPAAGAARGPIARHPGCRADS